MNNELITYLDWVLALFYILAIYAIASLIKARNIKNNPIYRYFLGGLFAKIIGGVSLCLIYTYYYDQRGDTMSYHTDSSVLLKLLFKSPGDFFRMWFSPMTNELRSIFSSDTGYLNYGRDASALMVVRLLVPIKLIGFDSYLLSSILMAVVSYTGVWKLYSLFCAHYPSLYKLFAITVLFVPSVLFWGSGLLKDSWTLAAAGWYTYSFYQIFINKKSIIFSSISLMIASGILILIKPYIFLGLLPGSILWMAWSRLSNIKSQFLRIISAPLILVTGLGLGFFVWSLTSSNLGEYSSMDSMLKKAVESSEDLKQDYYQGNSFDLGKFEPTLWGLVSKFPIAAATGLFRPLPHEANNVVMIFSGLENLVILGFAFFVLFRKPKAALVSLFGNPLVLFCLTFAVFFAFSVAISTSNFGALVRLRIPMIPFFLSGLVLMEYGSKSSKASHNART